MKMFIYEIVRAIRNWIFAKRGWVLGNNVTISIHGVKRIGGGKIYCANNVCINAYSF